ncbi:porin [Pseudacidovorax intermedius]|uniref:Putative porin n=1 Tax=Pseudacidovorax intermedius TaxID=433924 RepID=A0A370FH41_9BURK|nr:porin [Pseudacidovorax intermedius]RDI24360.1 putative porin [Pseudacidovorax intermedius]
MTSARPLPCLVALALASAATSSLAQSSVTVYGLVDLGFVRESGGPNGAEASKLTSGVSAGSRLGFRGAEDLGGGLAAVYRLEMGLNADTGTLGQGGRGFGRESWVGLQGDWGRVLLGRQYTPVAIVQVESDPFGTGLAGDSANLISPGGAGGSNRMDNTVRYALETRQGFTVDLAYGFGEKANDASLSREWGAAIGYVSGPVYVKLGHHNVNDANGKPGSMSLLAAKYDFGLLTAHFNYAINKGSSVFGVLNRDSRDVLLGVSVPYGPGRFLASYIRKDDRTLANNDANQWAVGYVHNLSRRTALYVSIARIHNNAPAGSATGFYRVGNATEQGLGSRAFNVGVRHAF